MDDLLWRDEDDCRALRRAASVLRRRSRRPSSFAVGVLCRVLEVTADKIERSGSTARVRVR